MLVARSDSGPRSSNGAPHTLPTSQLGSGKLCSGRDLASWKYTRPVSLTRMQLSIRPTHWGGRGHAVVP